MVVLLEVSCRLRRVVWFAVVALLCSLFSPVPARAQFRDEWRYHSYRPHTDILDYAFEIALPDSGARIRASAEITVRRERPLDSLVLDLADLRVTSVRIRSAAGAWARAGFVRGPASVRIPWSVPGDTMIVSLEYEGTVTDGLIARRDSTGRWTYFGDNWPRRAHGWLPVIDDPSDKATAGWTVTAPAGYSVVANGALQDTTAVSGARVRWRWREARPIPPHLMVIAAARMAHLELEPAACGRSELTHCVEESAWAYPESQDMLKPVFSRASAITDYFARIVGPFPYEKLAHLQSTTQFGGMENASNIFYGAASVAAGTLSEETIAHETAHQWFGDAVTPRSFAHLWLSEGFANYFEALWMREAHGDTAFLREMITMRRTIVASPATDRAPVVDILERDPMRLLNTNSYDRGAWVLHMLRTTLGDSAFFQGLRSYYARYAHGTAVTADLRAEMELSGHRPLAEFFRQWTEAAGLPALSLRWRYDRSRRQVVATVRQSGRLFRFPLTLGIVDSAGVMRRVRMNVAARETRTTLEMGSAPRAILLDPDVQLLFTER